MAKVAAVAHTAAVSYGRDGLLAHLTDGRRNSKLHGFGTLAFFAFFYCSKFGDGGIGLRAPWANGFAVNGLGGSAAPAPVAAASAGAAAQLQQWRTP